MRICARVDLATRIVVAIPIRSLLFVGRTHSWTIAFSCRSFLRTLPIERIEHRFTGHVITPFCYDNDPHLKRIEIRIVGQLLIMSIGASSMHAVMYDDFFLFHIQDTEAVHVIDITT